MMHPLRVIYCGIVFPSLLLNDNIIEASEKMWNSCYAAYEIFWDSERVIRKNFCIYDFAEKSGCFSSKGFTYIEIFLYFALAISVRNFSIVKNYLLLFFCFKLSFLAYIFWIFSKVSHVEVKWNTLITNRSENISEVFLKVLIKYHLVQTLVVFVH